MTWWIYAFASALVASARPGLRELKARSIPFLMLFGIGTGASRLAYFKALQMAPPSLVAPIDKISLAFTTILAAVVLGESIS